LNQAREKAYKLHLSMVKQWSAYPETEEGIERYGENGVTHG